MAFIEITGTVSRVFHNGKGVDVVEVFTKRDGTDGMQKFTLWFDEAPGLTVGDTGSWRGSHSVKVDEWTGNDGGIRHSAVVSINGAHAHGKPYKGSPASQQAVQQEPWAEPIKTSQPVGSDVWNTPADTSNIPF
jgi:hypothetical protein